MLPWVAPHVGAWIETRTKVLWLEDEGGRTSRRCVVLTEVKVIHVHSCILSSVQIKAKITTVYIYAGYQYDEKD